MLTLLTLLQLTSATAFAQNDPDPDPDPDPAVEADEAPPVKEEVNQKDGYGVGLLPALNFNSDEGFGYGVIGTLYRYKDKTRPYKYALTARFFLTTRQVNAHMVRLDLLDLGGLPIRVTARADYFSALAQNFCGYVGDNHCGPDADQISEDAADAEGLTGAERDDFLRRYYLMRYTETALNIQTRTKLKDLPHKREILAGYRYSYYIPGVFNDQAPWAGSLYDVAYFSEGETGGVSVLQLGMVYDNRDNEPAPNSGYWSEFSFRGATRLWGSNWTYGGVNLTHRQYVTIVPDKLVSATRAVADVTVGDLPTQDLVRVGGLQDYSAIGGQNGGRGLRAWRLAGQVKGLVQQEVRWTFARISPGTQRFDFGVLGFIDAGVAARAADRLDENDASFGTGGGLRITWNENFIVRADFGFSPIEDWSTKSYINLDHIF
ncbi:MAG: BamA/TamA family outer membrane protein [Myxococcota bacterium]